MSFESASGATDLTRTMEQDCFRRIAAGGTDANRAMTRLFRLYAPKFASFLRMRGVPNSTADDLIQAVFVKLLEARAGLIDVQHPGAYLWRMLRNALIDHRRIQSGRLEDSIDPGSEEAGEEGHEGSQAWLQRLVGDSGLAAEH